MKQPSRQPRCIFSITMPDMTSICIAWLKLISNKMPVSLGNQSNPFRTHRVYHPICSLISIEFDILDYYIVSTVPLNSKHIIRMPGNEMYRS